MAEAILRTSDRVCIRHVLGNDRAHLLALARRNQDFHQPWISPPLDRHTFRLYLRRTYRDDTEGLACCLRENNDIFGVININNIMRGSLLSGSIAYYADGEHAGQGYMTDAVNLALEHAFLTLGLHRVEAMIQPRNERSRALVARCGFHYEGLARDYQFINGEWRDHERWAMIAKQSGKPGHGRREWR